MSGLIWLSEAQMRRIEPNYPLRHRFVRWSRRSVSNTIFAALAARAASPTG